MPQYAPAEGRRNQMPQENRMGTMPIPKLLVSMAAPIMISMLIQALYNVVDSFFVAKISENALAGVSLAFPIAELVSLLRSLFFKKRTMQAVMQEFQQRQAIAEAGFRENPSHSFVLRDDSAAG